MKSERPEGTPEFMSRIGKKPVFLENGIEAKIEGQVITVKGPKGSLSLAIHPHVRIALAEEEGKKQLQVSVLDEELKDDRALWGLFRALLRNMVEGVTKGYEKKLEVNGVGFKAAVSGKKLVLEVGYSHEAEFQIPDGVTVTVEKNIITVSGIDKQQVGEAAANIRSIRKPEPYQGTGIKYVDEMIRRKAGKAASKSA